jgi:transcriptional regulator with XRE-family HTH domain
MTFAQKLKQKREAKGLRQADISKLLGITERHYQRYEASNYKVPPHVQIEKLNALFRFNFYSLLVDNKELSAAKKKIADLQKQIELLQKKLNDYKSEKRNSNRR